MIAIIDSGIANLRSVQKGFERVGHEAKVVEDPRVLNEASAIVLPGVGAFRDGIAKLQEGGFVEPLLQALGEGKPLLGICLGLHFLFSESEEFGLHRGLDIIKGKVVRFPQTLDIGLRTSDKSLSAISCQPSAKLKIPHMGWNQVWVQKEVPIFKGIPDGSYFYFVHSYYVEPEDKTVVAATTDYGIRFTSVVWKDNLYATQFHPEKSQALGLRLLKNFGDIARC